MAQQNDCSEILDLIPDYAFGLTDEATTRRIEAALPSCPEAVRQLGEYRRLQAAMRAHVPQTPPPPGIAQRLREAIQQEGSAPAPSMTIRQTPSAPQPVVMPVKRRHRSDPPLLETPPPRKAQTPPPSPPRPPAERPPATAIRESGAPPESHVPHTPRRADAPSRSEAPRRASSWLPLIAAAALIALVVTNAYWFTRMNSSSGASAGDSTPFMLSDAGNLGYARLEGMVGDYSAVIMWDVNSKTGLIYARNMPPLNADKVYQLWLLKDDVRVSGGTFTVSPDGVGSMIFTAPDPISEFNAAGITEEPMGGSDEPTSAPVCSGQL
jgi:hypothetical protein